MDLRNNRIKELPSDLNRLRTIKVISVKNNMIRRVPLCVAKMTTLHFLTIAKNPIEFPDKKDWCIAQDPVKYPDDKNRLTAETSLLKKSLAKHAVMSPSSSESGLRLVLSCNSNFGKPTESPQSSDAPPKHSRTGRFPIRPSMSSVSLDNPAAVTTSPSQHRPSVTSARNTPRATGTPPTASARRPSLEPTTANSDGDRNRSNSELSTSKMRKRMGMQVSRGGKGSAEILDLDSVNGDHDSLHHNRDVSTSSFLSNAMSVEGTDSSASPSTPPTLEHRDREGVMSRLSSLPENKRKSQYVDPYVELAQGVTFAMDQLEGPVKQVVDAIKKSHVRQRDLERACYNAFSAAEDLGSTLQQLGIHDEDEASSIDNSKSDGKPLEPIGDGCERCYAALQKLVEALQANVLLIVEHTDPKNVRMFMHMVFATTIEVNNAYKKFTTAATASAQHQHPTEKPLRQELLRSNTVRAISPSPRPTTSLRIKNPRDIVPNGDFASYFSQKPLPSPRCRDQGSTSSRPVSRQSSRLGEPRQTSTSSAISPSGSFISEASTFMESDDEERMFEDIVDKMKIMSEFAASNLPTCASALRDAKHRSSLASPGGRLEAYDQLLRMCDQELNTTHELKNRLQTLRIRDPTVRNDPQFWQLCTMFFKLHADFSHAIKGHWQTLSLPDLLRSRLGMIHARVKEAAHVTEMSMWKDQARLPSISTPISATWSASSFSPPASLYSPQSSVATPRSGANTSGRGLTINSSISSMASSHGNGSGYTTPLPATPISAALGPAAQATLGDTNGLPRSPMAHGHDLSIASLSGMPGWYSYAPDGTPLSGGAPANGNGTVQPLIIQQPSSMNRSASSASIRSMHPGTVAGNMTRSASQRR